MALPYTLPVFNFAILAREYFWWGFISAISTRKYEKRALNFAIYALSTSFNFFFKKSLKDFKFLVELEKRCVKAIQINVILLTKDTKRSLPV